jgi:N-acyl-D-aspartate/D-glutamate deacylase
VITGQPLRITAACLFRRQSFNPENLTVAHSLSSVPPRRGLSRLFAGTAVIGLLAAVWAAAPDAVLAQGRTADVLIRGGTIYTGAEQKPFMGDVAISGDKIVAVGRAASDFTARQTIDARGMIVAPGFIDAHSHPDTYIRSPDPQSRMNAPWLFQGSTTVLIGVDGQGTPDVKDEADNFARQGIGTNVVPYVGFGAVRRRVLHDEARAPTGPELNQEKALVAKGMCEGAVGFSAGLFYAPQSFAKTDEVIAIAHEAAIRGGLYDTHQRDESDYTIGLLNSVKEAIDIGREAGLPVHFAHIKALGVDVHGMAPDVINLINQARANGQDVTADEYPWLASGSSLSASLVPRWAVDGGYPAMIKRFNDPLALEKIKIEMRDNLRRRGGPDSMLLTAQDMPWTGKKLSEMAAEWKVEPVEAAIRVLRQTTNKDGIVSFNMIEGDVQAFMKQPWVVTSSDGSNGHPRQFASFPEKYAKYVKQLHIIDLQNFIRHSTGLTADMFKLDRRGYLRPGYFADVVVFDPKTFAPKADYVHPRVLSVGVIDLFVNGQAAINGGKLTNVLSGRDLLRTKPASCSL